MASLRARFFILLAFLGGVSIVPWLVGRHSPDLAVAAISIALLMLVGAGVWFMVHRIGLLQQAASAADAEVRVAALAGGDGDEIDDLARALADSLREQRLRGEELGHKLRVIEDQQRALKRLAADGELAASLASLGEVDDAVAQLGLRLRRMIPHERALLWITSSEAGERAWRIDGIAGHVPPPTAETIPEASVILDGSSVEPWGVAIDLPASVLVIPLRGIGGPIGCLVLGRDTSRFCGADVAVAESMAPILTSAIGRMCLGEQLQLARQVAVVGGFARMLAHELRNPLNSLTLQLELLHRTLSAAGRDDARIAARLDAVRVETSRLCELAAHYQGLTCDHAQAHFAPAELRRLVADAVAGQRLALDRLGASVETDLGDDPVVVDVDAERISLLLQNLMERAVDDLAQANARRLALRLSCQRGHAVVTLQHSGPAFDDLSSAFQPDPSRPADDGMGLPVGLQIARLHGGSLVARNPIGGGVELIFSLPLHRPGVQIPVVRR